MMTEIRLSILSLFLVMTVAGATDPLALKECLKLGSLKNICLGVIKNAQYTNDALKVCLELRSDSAKVQCLSILSNDLIEADLLKACDREVNDWKVIDCLKLVSNKIDLKFKITQPLPKPLWVKNARASSAAWEDLAQQVRLKIAVGYCKGWRYITPVNESSSHADCWSTRLPFHTNALPPDPELGPTYPVGAAKYSHCFAYYECSTY